MKTALKTISSDILYPRWAVKGGWLLRDWINMAASRPFITQGSVVEPFMSDGSYLLDVCNILSTLGELILKEKVQRTTSRKQRCDQVCLT